MTDKEANEFVDFIVNAEQARLRAGMLRESELFLLAPATEEEKRKRERDAMIGLWFWIALLLLFDIAGFLYLLAK